MTAKTSLPPGFRFHPTDVELVWYYLKRKIIGKPFRFEAISEVELYKFAPWDLPVKSCLRSKDLEWYFFCPRDRKYSNGSRTNRATEIGYWKTTGRDRSIAHSSQTVGMKKTLIFHEGKAPHGSRTDWVMYEFRLESKDLVNAGYAQDAYVLCKNFQKSGPGPKNGEQYGAPFKEEDWEDDTEFEDSVCFPSISPAENAHLFVPVPLQSVAPEVGLLPSMLSNLEVGEPSSAASNFEVGEPSHVPEPSKVGELPTMQDVSNVGEPFYMPGPFDDDGIFVDQLEAFLNTPQPHPENANDQMLDFSLRHENVTPAPDLDFVNVYGNLADLHVQPYPEPTDAITVSSTIGFENKFHPAVAEFADEHYMELTDLVFVNVYGNIADLHVQPSPEPTDGIAMSGTIGFENKFHPAVAEFGDEHYLELSDIGFAGEGNLMEFFAPDYLHPFANIPSSSGPDNTCVDNDVDTHQESESQRTGLAVAYDLFPFTLEDHSLRKE